MRDQHVFGMLSDARVEAEGIIILIQDHRITAAAY